MKKLLSLAMTAMLIVSASACTNKQTAQKEVADQTADSTKSLVAFFSATGTTAAVAKTLAEATGSDLFEIVPEKKYTDADLNWNDKQSRSTLEMKDKKSRPAVATKVEDMAQYDVIYLGYPIWWYTAPTIINTFLEQYDLSGKTIILFATSGGSQFENSVKDLQPSAPGAKIVEGRMMNGGPKMEELKAWADSFKVE